MSSFSSLGAGGDRTIGEEYTTILPQPYAKSKPFRKVCRILWCRAGSGSGAIDGHGDYIVEAIVNIEPIKLRFGTANYSVDPYSTSTVPNSEGERGSCAAWFKRAWSKLLVA